MKKRIAGIALTGLVIVYLCACGNKEKASSLEAETSVVREESEEEPSEELTVVTCMT